MAFNSVQYFLLLGLVLALYWQLGRRGQNLLLLVASYAFYAFWDWRFLSLLALSTVVDFSVGRAMGRTKNDPRRRFLLGISMAVNLGLLGAFKYFGFFVESAQSLIESLGGNANLPVLRVVLPVGISFYTFQTMSYTIDIYRGRLKPIGGLLRFAVFVSFFPQLVAGPIERAVNLLPQFAHRRRFPSPDKLRSAGMLILLGLVKKVAIADAIAPTVDRIFADPSSAGWLTLLLGVYAFAVQIYADFSAYTDIARGSGRLLGIELMENFQQPYLSRNITEFWRTWHISLSSWLRDYLYVPLGGNRRGPRRTAINLALTMLLGGLWHGAAWTFVIWGGLHGAYLGAHKFMTDRRPALARAPVRVGGGVWLSDRVPAWRSLKVIDIAKTVATFNLVCLAWIFFRADSLGQALSYAGGILSLSGGAFDPYVAALLLPTGLALLLIDVLQRRGRSHTVMLSWPAAPRGVFYAACCLGILLFSGGVSVPFIYFQF